jgi:hypothetical protein
MCEKNQELSQEQKSERIRQLVKEWLKSGQRSLSEEIKNLLQNYDNPSILRKHILERYKHGSLSVHVHIFVDAIRLVSQDYCAICHFSADDIDMQTKTLEINCVSEDGGHVQSSVLIDVCEFRENPQGVQIAERLPTMIRLQGIDECVRTCGNPQQSFAFSNMNSC